MRIEVIETLPSFERMEANWNAVYDADPEAQFFLSWRWLRGWLVQVSGPWIILAARATDAADAPYVGFLPLRIRLETGDIPFHNELNMAGNFAADYTGILSIPAAEHHVVPAFARHLKQMNWARLNLENFRVSDARFRLILAHFSKANFQVKEINRVQDDGIDLARCPFVTLPTDWNSYLDTLSANTRQKIRRLLKLVDADGAYRITLATSETIERDIDTLLKFWETRWGPRKGDNIHGLVKSNRMMLTQCFKSDLLYLPTFWQGDRPLAALAILIDARKRELLFYMSGRDESFDGPPSGLILHAHTIRHAIANGFTEYDFLRGNESYKYSFGAKERRIRCFAIGTKDGRNLGNTIDRRTVGLALKEATELHQAHKLAQAALGYKQILDVEPKNADAIHRLGQLRATEGDHVAAKRLFTTLTTLRPDLYKSWLCLAQSCEALGHHFEAANAYREVVRLQPDLPEAFSGLGQVLSKLGRIEEVNAALAAILDRDATSTARNGVHPARRASGTGAPQGEPLPV
ncbi:GNAT family N-acetyltransferase [Bradyrhizobium erythrophlei]|uniref:GNAT family N-acetyltransferase n=1 Tax=Bradyrhizobium erythrophlei TaxID=1437360 RepID=UPI0035ED1DF5